MYDSLGVFSSFEADYSGPPLFVTSYQRDSLGRITQINEAVNGISKKKNYAYNIAGRLWQVWRNDTLVSTYSYDPNGNRIAHLTSTKTDSGTYDAQDRMLTYGTAQYIYTKNGELQKKITGNDTTSYIYDYLGNLVTVRFSSGDRIDYIIDGHNRRIGKKLNGNLVKRWVYSGQLTPSAELDSSGNVTAQFIGNMMYKNGTVYQLITDHLGSIRLVIDKSSGAIAQQLDYDEFGNVTQNTNPDFQPFTYAGGLYDAQTKLVRFGARDYDAHMGRWTCKDPIGFGGEDVNIYAYCNDEPINSRDASGTKKKYVFVYGSASSGTEDIPLAGGGGNIYLYDPDTKQIRGYQYVGVGLGFGGGIVVSIGGGTIEVNNPDDITGWGWDVAAAAADVLGASGDVPANSNGNYGYGVGVTVGYGYSAGIEGTYTWSTGTYNINSLPEPLKTLLSILIDKYAKCK
jgi:RHS repeat-associated protein